MLTEKEAREQILKQVKEYCDTYHKPTCEYRPGDRISYASRVYDSAEMVNLVDSSLEFWLTSGRYTKEFEEKLCAYLSVKYSLLVNSGSSANLLAFMALTSPLLKERRINRGDEVITVAAGFPTTVAPIIQYGAVPVFIDITLEQLNVDVNMLEEAYSDKTKAVMLAHTLGNPFDIGAVKEFCNRHHLWLIEDNCDALGSEIYYDGKKRKTGTIGDIGTSSFYPPHHMTMGEGGAVYTNDALLYKCLHSMRDWGRECICPSGTDNLCGHRFDGQFGQLPVGYDHKYVYSHFGYNLKATDMQAAIGCAQLDKIDAFTDKRRKNHAYLSKHMQDLCEQFILPQAIEGADPSWFGFALTCKNGIDRKKIVTFLESRNIQTRMLFAGNLTKHPCCTNEAATGEAFYRVVGDLRLTNSVMENTFWVGVYPGMLTEQLDVMIAAIHEAAIG